MADASQNLDKLIDAALRLAAERPWSDVGLRDIAGEAEVDLATLRGLVDSKADIVAAFIRRTDAQVLSETSLSPPSETAPRDALFEVLMNRFDALESYKAALKSIAGPSSLPEASLIATLLKSQMWMLQAASVDADGLRGAMRAIGLASVYGRVFRTWLDDDDPGLARTMAALDRRLRRGERSMKTAENIFDAADGACKVLCSLLPSAKSRAKSSDETAGDGASSSAPPTSATGPSNAPI